MQNIDEFHQWIDSMPRDAKKKLGVDDTTIAFVLMSYALDQYIRDITRRQIDSKKSGVEATT